MRRMPTIPVVQKQAKMTTSFGGYNHQEIIDDGQMYETLNLSDDLYPALAPRKKRGITSYDVSGQASVPLTGIHGRDQLVFIRGTEVFWNFTKVTGLTVSQASNMLPKKIVSMGAYVCIWPDKVYFNTVDLSDKGSMERLYSESGSNISLNMCRGDGTDYDTTQITVSSTPPATPTNGQLWIDQSGDVDVLRQYTASTQEWTEVPSTYVKINGIGTGNGLNEYDCVDISGMEAPSTASEKIKKQVADLNNSMIVFGAGTNYVIVAGLLTNTVSALKAGTTVRIDRKVPDLDYICESNNRLWGCKYGMENGAVVNEIRASKLGDFRNWQCFMGLSTDSYTASIGTDGMWTGAIKLKEYPVFFKENCIHRVSGMTPGSFQITTTVCRGVQRGSWRSLQVVNEAVLYHSRDGVMMYDGSMPQSVSEQLGGALYSDARAGALKEKYYISMKNANDEWRLFTYDTKRGIWFREDNLKVLGFGAAEDELYAIDEEHNTMVAITGSMGTLEDSLPWKAEFGISGVEYGSTQYGRARTDYGAKHYMSRFDIRMYLEEGSTAKLEIMYNSSGEWENRGEIRGNRMKSFVLPVTPKRCDHLRFRLSGTGDMRIYSIKRIVEVGSDG